MRVARQATGAIERPSGSLPKCEVEPCDCSATLRATPGTPMTRPYDPDKDDPGPTVGSAWASAEDIACWDADLVEWEALAAQRWTRPRWPKPQGFVYVVSSAGRIKIGFSTDVESRIAALQRQSPFWLNIIHQEPGTPDDERALHDRFASCRLHGEWFEPDAAMLAWLDGLPR